MTWSRNSQENLKLCSRVVRALPDRYWSLMARNQVHQPQFIFKYRFGHFNWIAFKKMFRALIIGACGFIFFASLSFLLEVQFNGPRCELLLINKYTKT